MDTLTNELAVFVVSLIAAISPGPDVLIVLRNSLSYSRKAGFWTAFGISIALLVHLSYTIVGIGVLIAESPFLYTLIKYTGVAYLLYLGSTSLIASFKKSSGFDLSYTKALDQLAPKQALIQGILTNLLNPKCALFYISLFSQFIDPSTPLFVRVEYAFINWATSLGWFLCLAYFVTMKGCVSMLNQFRTHIDRTLGGALMLLGFKLLFA